MGLVACAVFKTVGRRLWRLRWVRFPHAPAIRLATLGVLLAAGGAAWPRGAGAQVVPIPSPQPQRPDSLRRDTIPVPQFRYPPPTPPLAAMGRSLLLPGWGQAVLHRRLTGGVFVFWEGLSLTMALKAANELHYLRQIDADSTATALKRQEVQDWWVVLIFNHLMSAAEAFVSAELWDFPGELKARSLPGGRVGAGPVFYLGQ